MAQCKYIRNRTTEKWQNQTSSCPQKIGIWMDASLWGKNLGTAGIQMEKQRRRTRDGNEKKMSKKRGGSVSRIKSQQIGGTGSCGWCCKRKQQPTKRVLNAHPRFQQTSKIPKLQNEHQLKEECKSEKPCKPHHPKFERKATSVRIRISVLPACSQKKTTAQNLVCIHFLQKIVKPVFSQSVCEMEKNIPQLPSWITTLWSNYNPPSECSSES